MWVTLVAYREGKWPDPSDVGAPAGKWLGEGAGSVLGTSLGNSALGCLCLSSLLVALSPQWQGEDMVTGVKPSGLASQEPATHAQVSEPLRGKEVSGNRGDYSPSHHMERGFQPLRPQSLSSGPQHSRCSHHPHFGVQEPETRKSEMTVPTS